MTAEAAREFKVKSIHIFTNEMTKHVISLDYFWKTMYGIFHFCNSLSNNSEKVKGVNIAAVSVYLLLTPSEIDLPLGQVVLVQVTFPQHTLQNLQIRLGS